MADFNCAYNITIHGNEGGWNPGIGEHPTYDGIDHGQHPGWPGWLILFKIINEYPGATIHTLNEILSQNEQLQTLVQLFYKSNFWDDLNLSALNDNHVANNIFDCSVNPCIQGAGIVFQQALNNVLSQFKRPLIIIDGKIGQATINAANTVAAIDLFNQINDIRKANYIERVRRTPSDQQWLKVWLSRLIEYKQ